MYDAPQPAEHPGFVRENRHVAVLLADILKTRGMSDAEAARQAQALVAGTATRSAAVDR